MLKKIKKIPGKLYSENRKRKFAKTGKFLVLERPFYLKGGKYISLGENFHAAPGVRIEAWDSMGEEQYKPSIVIGDDVFMNHNCHIGAINSIQIGNGVLLGSNVMIIDHNHGSSDYREELMVRPGRRQLRSKGQVVIEDNVWIGENSCVLPNVRIGKCAIVACGSVVTKDVPEFSVVAGNPAKVIKHVKERDVNNLNRS